MEEPKYLRHYLVRDPEEDAEGTASGYVVACSKEHAAENAGDLDLVLTGEHRPHDDPRDQCALCGWTDPKCAECDEEAAEMDAAHTGLRVFPIKRTKGQHRG